MKVLDIIVMCLRNLFRRKFRTFLTVSGVVIGTTAIVVMISLGIAISKSQDEMMASFGDLTVIDVWGYNPEIPLDDDAVTSILQIEGVEAATPFVNYYEADQMNIVGGRKDRYSLWPDMVGVYPDALEKLDYELLEGEYLPSVNSTKKIQVLVGEEMAYQFEDTKKGWRNNRVNQYETDQFGNVPDPFVNPMKDQLRLVLTYMGTGSDNEKTLEYDLEVVGRLKGDPQKDYYTMYGVFISVNDMKRITADYNKLTGSKVSSRRGRSSDSGYNSVKVKASDINVVTTVEEAIHALGFENTYSLENQRQEMQKSTQQIQMILGGLGAISLFVAAISITNTMIMSVYERTREIGVMKVLGCLVGNIRSIFLLEAGLIGFMGGVLGIGVSFFLSFLMNTFSSSFGQAIGNMMGGGYYMGDSSVISIIPGWLVLAGLAFATLIGLVSGFSPANRAVKISALEAIKQE